jgi:uncharacterized protein YigA (DUF484 family)
MAISSSHEPDREEEAQVAAYLQAHPDFFTHHPELLALLTPEAYHDPETGIVDLQRFLVDRLRGEVTKTQAALGELVYAARDNLSAQSQIHDAALQLLRCGNRTELLATLTQELPSLFDVDVIQLCVEADIVPDRDHPTAYGYHYVPRGTITRLLGRRHAFLGTLAPEDGFVFADAEGLIASCALLKLALPAPHLMGMLAIGVREPHRFYAGQGTELLRFLAATVGVLLAKWDAR